MSRSEHSSTQLSTFTFPERLRDGELLLRGPQEADIDVVAPAFLDPAVGGEEGCLPSTPRRSAYSCASGCRSCASAG